jgi:hypothetical protein
MKNFLIFLGINAAAFLFAHLLIGWIAAPLMPSAGTQPTATPTQRTNP